MPEYCLVPKSFTSGDSVSFSLTDPAFPASSWAMSLVFSLVGSPKATVEGEVDGGGFTFDLDSETSKDMPPGSYNWAILATNEGERKTVARGSVGVRPDPTQELTKSPAQEILAGLLDAMQRLSSGTNQSVSINGQTYTKRDMKQMQDAIDRQRAVVNAELRRLGLSKQGGAKSIQTVF